MTGKLFIGVVAAAVLAVIAFGIWRVSQLPLQPARLVMARVVAIAPPISSGAGRPPRGYIVVRNAHGTGEFALTEPEIRCEVGQQVQVVQRGIVLTPLPTTCK
ncbi:MAG TPA: hypothetical protein VFD98_16855 [Terracidiphilus sp.]|jgi:hypothetical protein|nr:hypothetical protein [Terracidiphilus sp.]